MSENPKIKAVRKVDVVIHEDLRRLAKSMRMVLIRRYPNAEERKLVAAQIMHEVRGAAI